LVGSLDCRHTTYNRSIPTSSTCWYVFSQLRCRECSRIDLGDMFTATSNSSHVTLFLFLFYGYSVLSKGEDISRRHCCLCTRLAPLMVHQVKFIKRPQRAAFYTEQPNEGCVSLASLARSRRLTSTPRSSNRCQQNRRKARSPGYMQYAKQRKENSTPSIVHGQPPLATQLHHTC
jgi:hypothetical protein